MDIISHGLWGSTFPEGILTKASFHNMCIFCMAQLIA